MLGHQGVQRGPTSGEWQPVVPEQRNSGESRGSRAPDRHSRLGIPMSISQAGKQRLRNAKPRVPPRKEKGQRGAGSTTLALGPCLASELRLC